MKKTNLSSFSNSWYKPGSIVIRTLWFFTNLFFIKNNYFLFVSIKVAVLRLFKAEIGKGVIIKPGVNIKYPWFLEIGDNVWIGEGVWIDNLAKVYIGDNVCISQGAMLLTGNHNYKKSTFDLMIGEIVIEDGVWIGAKAVVCPGVVCESHAVLSVASIAVSNLEAYTIYQGNPAKAVKKRVIE